MNSAMSCSNNKHALDDGKRTAKLVSPIPNIAHGRLYRRNARAGAGGESERQRPSLSPSNCSQGI